MKKEKKEYFKTFNVNGKEYFMNEREYNKNLKKGNKHPVIIGDELFMVNDNDLEILISIQKEWLENNKAVVKWEDFIPVWKELYDEDVTVNGKIICRDVEVYRNYIVFNSHNPNIEGEFIKLKMELSNGLPDKRICEYYLGAPVIGGYILTMKNK